MTTPETATEAVSEPAVYYPPSIEDRTDALERGLRELSAVPSATVLAPVEQYGADAADFAVVVGDRVPETVAEVPAVWASTDADVLRAARERPGTVGVHWGLGDDWDALDAQLATARERLRPEEAPDATGIEAEQVPTADIADAADELTDIVVSLDGAGRVTYANDAATAAIEFDTETLTGEVLWDHVVDPVAEALEPAVERALTTGETQVERFELAGGVRLFDTRVVPDDTGVTLVTLRSGQGESDDDPSLYEYLVETVGDAVYILDTEGHFVYVNDALCEMTGYSREELLGSSVHIIKDEATVDEAEEALADLLRERADEDGDASIEDTDAISIAKLDVELVRKDGERVPATDRMTVRPLEDGEFTGTVGTLRDISRQRRRQEILSGIIDQTREMMTATEAETVADLVVETAMDVFDIDLATLRKYDPETDTLATIAQSRPAAEELGDPPVYDADQGPVGTAFAEDRLVVREDTSASARDLGPVEVSAYCPVGDQYVLAFGTRSPEGFSDDALRLVEVLANTAGAAFDRVRREENLRQYEAIVEAAEDMLFTLDEDGTFTLVTKPFARTLGYDQVELIGRDIAEFVSEDEASVVSPPPEGETAVETTFQRLDGQSVPARLTLSPFRGSFETGYVGTVRDISQLRSAQREASRQRRRFTELFETLSDPVADLRYEDGLVTVERVNPAFATLCDADAEALRRATLAAVRDELPPDLAAALNDAGDPETVLDREVTVQTGAGERHFLLRTAPYEGDEADRAFVVLTEVTELKQRGTHLKVLHRLLRHNLRNETTLIRGHAEQVRTMDTRAEVDHHAERIAAASAELVRASETSQTLQRVLGMDPDEVDPERVDTVVDRLRQEVDGVADDDTTITVSAADAATDHAVPYSRHLLTAVAELVDNAVRHTDTDTVAVDVARDGDEDRVRVTVADDGDGIPRDQWDLLTGDREITQLQHGDGLGLWLVKWVTDRHSGRLQLEQADEDGTTVSVVLPTR